MCCVDVQKFWKNAFFLYQPYFRRNVNARSLTHSLSLNLSYLILWSLSTLTISIQSFTTRNVEHHHLISLYLSLGGSTNKHMKQTHTHTTQVLPGIRDDQGPQDHDQKSDDTVSGHGGKWDLGESEFGTHSSSGFGYGGGHVGTRSHVQRASSWYVQRQGIVGTWCLSVKRENIIFIIHLRVSYS